MPDHQSHTSGDELSWGDFLGMGVAAAGILAAGLCIGLLVDHWLATFPVMTMIGLAVGIVGTCTYGTVQMKRALKGPNAP